MENKNNDIIREKSTHTLYIFSQKIWILLIFIMGLYILYLLTNILTILFFSSFLTILFSPLLTSMNRKKIPDWLGLIIIFFGIALFFFIVLFAIIPIFAEQIILLFSYLNASFNHLETLYKAGGVNALGFPVFLKSYIATIDFGILFEWMKNNVSSISAFMGTLSKNVLQSSTSFLSTLSGGIFQVMMIGIFTFFMSLERMAIKTFLYKIAPDNLWKYLIQRESSFIHVLSSWMKGQIILCATIFWLTLIWLLGLQIFGIKIESIFTLALIAGLMEFIPYIGPFFALLPALAIVAGWGMIPIISIIILYTLIQQTENNILVPMIMSKTLDLSPFFILIIMTIMASLFGIAGILLAIPFAAILQIIVNDFLDKKSLQKKSTPVLKNKS